MKRVNHSFGFVYCGIGDQSPAMEDLCASGSTWNDAAIHSISRALFAGQWIRSEFCAESQQYRHDKRNQENPR